MTKQASRQSSSSTQKRALTWALGAALAAGVYILWPFVTVIIVSAIAAYIFYPVFSWLQRKTKRSGMAASLTLLASFVAVLIPFTIVVLVTAAQVQVFIKDADSALDAGTELVKSGKYIDEVNNVLDKVTLGHITVTTEQLQSYGLKAASAIGEFFLGVLKGSLGSVTAFITNIIIYIYVFTALLMHQAKLIKVAKQLNPLGDDVADIYLRKSGAMTKGMVRGQFIIAVCQGLAGAAFLYIAGLHYFAFFALILSIFSVIPLGGGIISIPIGFMMLLSGNIAGGLLVLVGHFAVVTNIDNVLRPKLVPKSASLNSALTIVSVLSGVTLFGFLGIVIGPVLMILVVATIEVYIAVKEQKTVRVPANG